MNIELFGEYAVEYSAAKVGKLTVKQDGLRAEFSCECVVAAAEVLRLAVLSGDHYVILGVMFPDGDKLKLDKKLSKHDLRTKGIDSVDGCRLVSDRDDLNTIPKAVPVQAESVVEVMEPSPMAAVPQIADPEPEMLTIAQEAVTEPEIPLPPEAALEAQEPLLPDSVPEPPLEVELVSDPIPQFSTPEIIVSPVPVVEPPMAVVVEPEPPLDLDAYEEEEFPDSPPDPEPIPEFDISFDWDAAPEIVIEPPTVPEPMPEPIAPPKAELEPILDTPIPYPSWERVEPEPQPEPEAQRVSADNTDYAAVPAEEILPEPQDPMEWHSENSPADLFTDEELRSACRGMTGALSRQTPEFTQLAIPFQSGKPFPLMPIFCFGTSASIDGQSYLVFDLKNGNLVG